jgi:rare lipoprotein A
MTAAHPTLPIPSYARVTRVATGRSVIVRINDRGPFLNDRIIDLSYVAAAKLGLVGPGSGRVVVQAITNEDILAGRIPSATRLATTNPPASATPLAVPRPTPIAAGSAAAGQALPPTTAAGSAPSAGPAGIYLQFGAFASADNAQALAQRINARANVLPRVSFQASLYKVRLGPYASRDEAAQAASMLAQSAGMSPAIAQDPGL